MCGITGFCDFNRRLTKDHLHSANEVLRHRGPDSGDTAFFELPQVNIGLGHRRLSIMDISANGSQPMYSDDKSVVVILNGEIYNFKEIRTDLISKGHRFFSESDTEVIIKSYQQYGMASLGQFIGMFAYVLYDLKKQLIYLVRDRAGVKPLYYHYTNGSHLFASELKSIYTYPGFEKDINQDALTLFFKYGFISAPHTIFKNTYKVKPGHYITIDLARNKVEDTRYWDVLEYYNKPKLKITEQEALEETERLFVSAFQYRMVSDVPVGVFLSGGYDSSVVTAILQKNTTRKIKTFTIGFNEKEWDEAPYAKKVAEYLGTDHYEHYCTTKDAQAIFPNLADIYDEPFGDSSGIPTTLISQFARKHVTVSLSADGGDEIFAGYYRYDALTRLHNFFEKTPEPLVTFGKHVTNLSVKLIPSLKKIHKVERLAEILNTYKQNGLIDISTRHLNHANLTALMPQCDDSITLDVNLERIGNNNDFMNRVLAFDYLTYMVDDILTKVDRATMTVGLEGREPLLDHRIIEFVSQLPSELKYHQGDKKYLLKKITHKYLPREMMDRPKTGFSIPVYKWFTTEMKDYLMSYINEEQISKHNLLDKRKAIAMRDDFLSGNKRLETPIWLLLMFQMWWNRWM